MLLKKILPFHKCITCVFQSYQYDFIGDKNFSSFPYRIKIICNIDIDRLDANSMPYEPNLYDNKNVVEIGGWKMAGYSIKRGVQSKMLSYFLKQAWRSLHSFSWPLARVWCQANEIRRLQLLARLSAVRTVGICSSSRHKIYTHTY